MKPRVLAVAALAALLLLAPTAAQAKGATAATIDGGGPGGLPGGPITLRGDGEPGSGTDLGMLAEGAGVFAVMFEDGSQALPAAPTDRLGPRYTITWTFPDPNGGKDRQVRQHVYPYAAGGPVTFMPAGQPVFDTTTSGGWYQGFDALRVQLIELGLPNRDPLPQAPPHAPAVPNPQPATGPRHAHDPGPGLAKTRRSRRRFPRPHRGRSLDPAPPPRRPRSDRRPLTTARYWAARGPARPTVVPGGRVGPLAAHPRDGDGRRPTPR